ncbi:MAG TPA: GtrA family protein [Streptosporangiaceae bacterium]
MVSLAKSQYRANALYSRFATLLAEAVKFGTVGATAAVVDLGGTAYLHGVVGVGPLKAKAVAVGLATVASYLGNRFWAFRHRANHSLAREWIVFFVLNGLGLLIAESVIALTYYGLDQRGAIAFNAANVAGTGLGTVFRFWSYRKWVFIAPPVAPVTAGETRDLATAGQPGLGR